MKQFTALLIFPLIAAGVFGQGVIGSVKAYELTVNIPEKGYLTRTTSFVRIESFAKEEFLVIIRKRDSDKKTFNEKAMAALLQDAAPPVIVRKTDSEQLLYMEEIEKKGLITRVWIYRTDNYFYTIWTTWQKGELDSFFRREFFAKSPRI